jgi:hypothetical protein
MRATVCTGGFARCPVPLSWLRVLRGLRRYVHAVELEDGGGTLSAALRESVDDDVGARPVARMTNRMSDILLKSVVIS